MDANFVRCHNLWGKPLSKNPIAFMSYVRLDDQHERGRLSQFRERLSGEVRIQTGEAFEIFQDHNDIAWGQQWKERIDEALDAVTFLIPVITPAFFRSDACREELERFLQREESLNRTDLILPVYYIECDTLSDEAKREGDPLAKAIAARQFADWRELRFEPFSSPEVGRRLAAIAKQIVVALERNQPASSRPMATRKTSVASDTVTPIDVAAGRLQKDDAAGASEGVQGPAPKTETPTLVVDAFHRGDHATLTQALKAAQPGTRIMVRPGLYQEGIVIDKPVEIIGDGEKANIVLEASGKNSILFKSSMGRIVNLTLRQTGGGEWFGIDISQGRLDVEDCDISSQSLACVGIHGGADPRLRRNRIYNGKSVGVLVYDNGQGTLEGNEIFGNALAGVEIREGGNLALRRNRIYDGKAGGVFINHNGQGTLEDNEIFGNALAGVEIGESSNPTLRRNRIYNGKSVGVLVRDNGQGTLEGNEIFGNALAGVEIREGGNPALRRNCIYDEKAGGVFINHNGQGTLEDNEIFGNALAGVEIGESSNPALRRNRIYDGKACGVLVHTNGQGTLEDNEIFGNALAGVEIGESSNPTLRRNRISKNGYEGIWVKEGGSGIFEENDLRGNTGGAWDIAAGSESSLKRTGNLE